MTDINPIFGFALGVNEVSIRNNALENQSLRYEIEDLRAENETLINELIKTQRLLGLWHEHAIKLESSRDSWLEVVRALRRADKIGLSKEETNELFLSFYNPMFEKNMDLFRANKK